MIKIIGLILAMVVLSVAWLFLVRYAVRVKLRKFPFQHLYPRYTPREWLFVILLICLSGYVVHNERRAFILIHAELVSIENSRLQQQLIQLNRERMELLHELMFGAHRLPSDDPPFPGGESVRFEEAFEIASEEER